MRRCEFGWGVVLGIVSWFGFSPILYCQSAPAGSDMKSPTGVNLVTKEYPDGTRQVVRWADLGAGDIDKGEAHGGAPKIVPFDANKDGFVPVKDGRGGESVTTPLLSNANQTSFISKPKIVPYQPDELYCRFQLGLTFIQSQRVEEVNGVSSSSNLSFGSGLRGMFELGGDLLEYLALEGNVGASWNSINQGSNAALYQIPAMAGIVAKYPFHLEDGGLFTPYIGLDCGVRALLYESLSFVPNGQNSTYSGSPTYIDPTWQIRTGFLVGLQDDWQLAVGYSFLGSWGSIGTSNNIDLGSLGTSTLEVGFQAKF